MKLGLRRENGRRPRGRQFALLGSVLLIGSLVTACGSSNSNAGKTATSADPASVATCIQKSDKILADSSKSPPFSVTRLPKPVSQLALAGKTAWFLAPLTSGPFATMGKSFEDAGKAAGVSTRLYDSGSSATTQIAAINQAVTSGAAFIVMGGVKTDLVTPALQAALAAHIPMVTVFEPLTTDLSKQAIKSVLTVDYSVVAGYGLAQALKATNCNMTMGFLYSSTFAAHVGILQGMQDQLPKICSACKLVSQEYNLQTLATTAGPQAVAMINSNTGMNYMYLASAGLIPNVLSALGVAKAAVKVGGVGATAAGLAALKDQTSLYDGDTATGSYDLIGWLGMDYGLRVFGNFPEDKTAVVPLRQLTKTTDQTDLYPTTANYPQLFTTAWKG
jgi:ABC-type sugar transport system substrate-binding protein